MIASNFEEYEYKEADNDKLKSMGFHLGAKVVLTKRMSPEWDIGSGKAKETARNDVPEGTETFIKGFESKNVKPVVEFNIFFKGKTYTIHCAVKPENLKLAEAASGSGGSGNDKGVPDPKLGSAARCLGKEFAWLDNVGEDKKKVDKVELINNWYALLMNNDNKWHNTLLQWDIGMMLGKVLEVLPTFKAEDFILVRRGGSLEVWTARSFKKGELMLGPEAHEIKDKYWTQDRAARVVNSDNLNPSSTNRLSLTGG